MITALAVPLVLNRPEPIWFALSCPGDDVRRHRAVPIDLRPAAELGRRPVFGVALAMIVIVEKVREVSFVRADDGSDHELRSGSLTFVVAYLAFGGALLLRRFRFPGVLVWLGAISYSLYLWHAVVLRAISPTAYRPLTFAVWLAGTIVVSALSYRYIEQPCIRLGRKVSAQVDSVGSESLMPREV